MSCFPNSYQTISYDIELHIETIHCIYVQLYDLKIKFMAQFSKEKVNQSTNALSDSQICKARLMEEIYLKINS